ncbi:MAG: nucleoside hydrolase [Nitrospirae bacterium]|nr:nucleoside hydrolase [Nitrospirota bacterium]
MPEAFVPNLYFFRPRPENFNSPLFARQYEKIRLYGNEAQTGDQYHRIHPLTKAGLDLERFCWIKWYVSGEVEFVDYADEKYHGKDFWNIPLFRDEKQRSKDPQQYMQSYNALLKRFNIKPAQPPSVSPTSYEIEYKFLVDKAIQDKIFDFLAHDATDIGLHHEMPLDEISTKEQIDTYFDDEKLMLNRIGASFRIREKKENIRVTLKKRVPVSEYAEESRYERMEEEATITKAQRDLLFNGGSINALPFRLITYIAPLCSLVKPILKVINKRKTVVMEDASHRKVEISFDKVFYEFAKAQIGPYYEIEFESKGLPRDGMKKLVALIEEKFSPIQSLQSKYQRGVSLMKTKMFKKDGQKLVIIDTDCGVDDALALIIAFKSPELQVKAVTTVSGNVHIDKVIPNVFKVFNALKLETFPIVSRGADGPIIKIFEPVPSVHGDDGLGDVASITYPDNIRLDGRPAWRVICDLAREFPKKITLVTLGPMTNLAHAIENDPEGVKCLKEVVAMGGVFFNIGNIRADAEFNVFSDPDAAKKAVEFCKKLSLKKQVDENGNALFLPKNPREEEIEEFVKKVKYVEPDPSDANVVPLTFIGLDVTHKVVLRRKMLDKALLGTPKNNLLKFVQNISAKYMTFYEKNEGLKGCYLHDPLAVGYVINPSFLEIEKHIINVEDKGSFTSGIIFPDDRPTRNPVWRNPAEEVIGIARNVEIEAFEEFFMTILTKK